MSSASSFISKFFKNSKDFFKTKIIENKNKNSFIKKNIKQNIIKPKKTSVALKINFKKSVISNSKTIIKQKIYNETKKCEYYLAHWSVPPKPAEFKHVTAYCCYNPVNNTQFYIRFDGKEYKKSSARLKKIPVSLEAAENYRTTFIQ